MYPLEFNIASVCSTYSHYYTQGVGLVTLLHDRSGPGITPYTCEPVGTLPRNDTPTAGLGLPLDMATQ
ncbi:hypothetical protein FKM82_006900 [Ascaphus truei]